MKVRRLGFIAIITITFILGWFLHAWSAAQTEERESYKKEVQEKLKALDKKIDELKGKGAGLEGEAKTEYNKEMTELRKKEKAAKKEWGKIKRATANNWEKVKADMDAAVHDVESAYDKVASRLKESTKTKIDMRQGRWPRASLDRGVLHHGDRRNAVWVPDIAATAAGIARTFSYVSRAFCHYLLTHVVRCPKG